MRPTRSTWRELSELWFFGASDLGGDGTVAKPSGECDIECTDPKVTADRMMLAMPQNPR